MRTEKISEQFVVIEQRGCSIEYAIFDGTLEECENCIEYMIQLQREELERPAHERDLHSGAYRNVPFHYDIVAMV